MSHAKYSLMLALLLGTSCLVAQAGCGSSDDDPAGDAGGPHDAAQSHLDAQSQADAASLLDASEAGPQDGGNSADASDAAHVDGGAPPDRRSQICGQTTSWPDPLPAQRKAAPVGTATFGFLEGPVWIAELGVLLFSDMDFAANPAPQGPPGRIRRLTPPATFDVFVASSNSNGLALTTTGELLAATHDTQALSLLKLDTGARTPVPLLDDGKHFNSPNDLTVRSDGTVYFTDPDWQLKPRSSETGRTGVYRVSAPLSTTTNTVSLVDGTLDNPNGIALSPDEQTLYVGSSGKEIWKYALASDGSVGARSKFAEPGGSDGLTVDCAGNLYVTSGTVEVFAPNGDRLGEITLDGSPSNVAFGGADRKTLYITAGSRLYEIKLAVPGFPY